MKIKIMLALCLVFALALGAAYSRYQAPQWIEPVTGDPFAFRTGKMKIGGRGGTSGVTNAFQIGVNGDTYWFDASGVTRISIDENGNVVTFDSGGVTTQVLPSDSVVLIDNVNDLSTWGARAPAGASYFQTEPGKTYIVDFVAIIGTGDFPTSGVSRVPWSGVSAILPDASQGDGSTVKFIIGATSSGNVAGTAYAPMLTGGTTTLQIWSYPGRGVTDYSLSVDGTYDGSPQNAARITMNMSQGGLGAVVELPAISTTGVSVYELDQLGESLTVRLDSGAVSAYPTHLNAW
jgi:hypothetical protein